MVHTKRILFSLCDSFEWSNPSDVCKIINNDARLTKTWNGMFEL